MSLQLGHLSQNTLPLLAYSTALLLFYVACKCIYNIYFHPLAIFPGPKRAVISNWWYAKHWLGGRWPYDLEKLHTRYGPVVRYAPDDLDFATPQSYLDVHGHAIGGKPTFRKGHFYDLGPESKYSIVTQTDPAKHREIRRSLSHAFSAKALRLQTDVVLNYVNIFTDQLRRLGNTDEGISADEWYNWLTFDIIGDLTFGESFGAVENARTHPWVKVILNSIFGGGLRDVLRRLPYMKIAPGLLMNMDMLSQRKQNYGFISKENQFSALLPPILIIFSLIYSRYSWPLSSSLPKFARSGKYSLSYYLVEKIKGRLEKDNDRDDFFSHLLSDKAVSVTPEFLKGQAGTLISAGSETTATFLTGTTFYLLKNPSTLHHLTQEIRNAFSDKSMINADNTQSLPYLFAVIEEGLRIFPPAPAGFHRLSPGAFVDGYFVPEGYTVSTSGWTTTHSPNYWLNPNEFHPERWLPEDHKLYDPAYKNDVKEASKPFIIGPRACLGINLAYMEMRVILSRLMWEFDLTLINTDLDWERDTELRMLWKKPNLRVRFRPVVKEEQKAEL